MRESEKARKLDRDEAGKLARALAGERQNINHAKICTNCTDCTKIGPLSRFLAFSLSRFLAFSLGGRIPSSISTSKAREFLADLITEVAYKGERVVLTRHGKPVAALISSEDLERLEELDLRSGRSAAPP